MACAGRAWNIGSVYHASVVRGCVPVSASSSLIYHFSFVKHHHSAARHHHHRHCETLLSYPWKLHACRANQIYFLYFIFCSMYLVLFSIVLYRTIVTIYTDNIFIYNYLWQMHQIIHLSLVGCFTRARGKTVQKNREVSSVKRAIILHIFKNKDKLDITNFSPISILPVISKVYKKVFYNRLYNYYYVNNLLSSSQFGFRSGASTEHALLKFSDEIFKNCLIRRKSRLQHLWIWVKRLTVWIIIFYYPNSNDMASMRLHCNGSIVTYQTGNIFSPFCLTHLYLT